MEDNSGKKYVIELGDGFKLNGKTLYPVKGFNSLVFDEFGLSKLKSFDSEIERDKIYDAAFQAGVDYQYSKDSESLTSLVNEQTKCYQKGYADGKMAYEDDYDRGLSDMYNAVCAILFPAGKTGLSDNEINQIFGTRMITDIFEKNSIPWQTGELGRIDAGGGGTIAAIMAKLGMDVVDMGVPVWSMHAPVEVISKIDLYYLYLGYKAFIENIG